MWQVLLLTFLATCNAVIIHQSPYSTAKGYDPVPLQNLNAVHPLSPYSVYPTPSSPITVQPRPHPQTIITKPSPNYLQQQTYHQPITNTLPVSAPTIPKYPVKAPLEDYDEPSYSFTYEIHDALTGDDKSHTETRQGDVVTGSYSLIEPDGSRRIVDYTADKLNGFRANVRKEPATQPIAVAPQIPVRKPFTVPPQIPATASKIPAFPAKYAYINNGYKPVPAQHTYTPVYSQQLDSIKRYQGVPVLFNPAKYQLYNPTPAPVSEQKYTTATLKPTYNPVVYASQSKEETKKNRTPPGLFTNPNHLSYNPVIYA